MSRSLLAFSVLLVGAVVLGCRCHVRADDGAVTASPTLEVPSVAETVSLFVPIGDSAGVIRTSPENAGVELAEVDTDGAVTAVFPAQVEPAADAGGDLDTASQSASHDLLAVIPPRASAEEVRRFRVRPMAAAPASPFNFRDAGDASLGLWQGDTPVFVYNHGEITGEHVPPEDARRRRGCYLHPVWSPSGTVLTDDFPQDHFHHHGIFWAWPHVVVGGQEYDLWSGAEIRQRFIRWIDRRMGPVAAVLAVENGWFVAERCVMIERVWMRAFRADGGHRALDVTLTLIPQDRPVTLQGAAGKSYGGLTMRFAPRDDKRTVITVPSGLTTDDLPDTPLPWADFTSLFAGASKPAGATVMVDPAHPAFPPTWLTRHYGALFVGYPGVDPQTFASGEPITLGYRVDLHDGQPASQELARGYRAYCAGRQVGWVAP
ncbi:MAG: DUF6807 family protein [Pirellulales bacterium]